MISKRLNGLSFGILMFLLVVAPSLSAESKLSLQDYLKLYLRFDESFQQKIEDSKDGQQNLQLAEDFYQSSVNFRAERSERDTSFPVFPGQDFEENRNSLTGTYSQDLKWGMQAEFRGRRFIGKSNPALGAIDEEYNISLSQSLWKNPLGKLSFTRQKKRQFLLEELKIQEKVQLARSCQNGLTLYLDAWGAAESYKIVKEMEGISEKALRAADMAFQKRLMREIDLLSAQADRIDARELSSRSLARRDQNFLGLLNYSQKFGQEELKVEDIEYPALSLPLSFLDEKEDDFDLEESFQVMAEEKAFKAAQLNTQQVQQEERSDVSLGVSLGRREGDVNIGSVVTDYQEESAQIFIEMDWPVVDKSRDAMRAKAMILERKAELNHRQTKREILEKVHELRTNRRELLKQIDMAYDKIEISQKQVKRAMGLIKTGKIEFEDFARFRKGLLQARISTVELRQQLVKEQAQLSMLGPTLLNRCKELL